MPIGVKRVPRSIRDMKYCQMLLERGWTPYAMVFLFVLALCIMFVKWRKLVFQKKAFKLELVPSGQGFSLTSETALDVIATLNSLVDELIADSPEYYSLYGLVGKVDPSRKIVAISKGKPDIKRPNYESSWTITSENGDLLSFNRMSFAKELKANDGADAVLMPSSDEMRTIVEFAKRADASAVSFESEILKIIAKHLLKSHADGFVAAEKKYAKNYNPIRGWRSPYRCVQFLDWYMRWLREDLKMMPNDYELTRWHDELNRLASPVVVDGVDESLAWICIS